MAVAALPARLPMMVPAAKFPLASRLTRVLAVFAEVALLESVAPEAMLAAVRPPKLETTVADCVPVTSPIRLPVKLVELPAVVAVAALPFRVPVMIPAEKFPLASRATSVLAVFAAVELLARVAPAAIFAALMPLTVEITVAPCVPVTSPVSIPVKLGALVAVLALPFSAAVIVPAVKFPLASRLTRVLAVLAWVAAFARVAPAARLVEVMPPTVDTTVAA